VHPRRLRSRRPSRFFRRSPVAYRRQCRRYSYPIFSPSPWEVERLHHEGLGNLATALTPSTQRAEMQELTRSASEKSALAAPVAGRQLNRHTPHPKNEKL